MNDEPKLGEYFCQFRMARHIPLAAATSGAKSTLLRFEKGGQLSTERMYATMARMGMWVDDICAHFEAFNAPFNLCAEALIDHRYALTPAIVAESIAEYLQRVGDQQSRLHTLNQQVLAGLQQLAQGLATQLGPDVQVELESILTVPHLWLTYDYLLLRLAAAMIDSKRLMRCVQAMQAQPQTVVAGMHQYVISVQEQAVMVFLCRHEESQAQALFAQIEVQQADNFWIKDTFILNLLKALLFDQTQLPEIMGVLEVLELSDMAGFCQRLIAIVQGRVKGALL